MVGAVAGYRLPVALGEGVVGELVSVSIGAQPGSGRTHLGRRTAASQFGVKNGAYSGSAMESAELPTTSMSDRVVTPSRLRLKVN